MQVQQKDRLTSFGYATAKDGFKELYNFQPELKSGTFSQLPGNSMQKNSQFGKFRSKILPQGVIVGERAMKSVFMHQRALSGSPTNEKTH